MPARKARKLADGSREETFEESDDFSLDEEFSLEEGRTHKSLSIRPSLEFSGQHSDNDSQIEERSSTRKKVKKNESSNGHSQFSTQTSSLSDNNDDDDDDDDQQSDDDEVNDVQNDLFTQTTNNDVMSQEQSISDNEQDELYSQNDELLADCGTVESLTLVNFMCHEHFEITFNPRVNFVIGKNGSGKSAILTAIVIVLGGRATNTGRGQSLTGFIKNGKQSAKIIVKLCNHSTSKKKTFKYAEYGRSIIIERIIKSDGTSNYALKSCQGRIISRKKEELNEIINLFAIQIENPVCILSQEVSRNFLNSKNARDKYTFFMKATNLEQLRQSYAIALQQSRTAKEILIRKKEFLPGIHSELKELEKRVDVLTKFNKKKDHLNYLLSELLWTSVRELEIVESKLPLQVDELDKKIADCNARYDEIKESDEELERIKNDFDTTIHTQFQAEMKELEKTKADIVKRHEQLRKSKAEKQFSIQETNFSLTSSHQDKVQLTKKIEEIKKQIEEQEKLMAEQERIKEKRVELQNKQDEIKSQVEQLRQEKSGKQEECSKLSEKLGSLNYRINKVASELSNKNNLLKNLEGSGKDSLAKFGSTMVRFVRMIDDEDRKGKFHKKPIGPLGYYIKLKNNQISTALETCLKGLMFAFVCDNHADADVLLRIMRSCNFNHQPPMILRRKFGERFNIRNEVSLDRYKSFLSYIAIENDQVFNILMDKSNLDQTLYIPTDKTAVELLTNESRVPSNLKVAYSENGSQFYPKKNNSNFRQYGNNRRASGILASDTTSMMNQLKTDISQLEKEIQCLQVEKSELDSQIKSMKSVVNGCDKEIDKHHAQINKISRELYELSSIKEFKPEDLSIFEDDYKLCIEQIAQYEEQKISLKEDLVEIEEKIKILKNDLKLHETEMQEKREKFELIKKRVSENDFYSKKNKDDMEKIEKRVAEFNDRKSELLKDLTRCRMKKEIAIEKAKEKHSEPIETRRSEDEIQNEIDELHAFLRENENRVGDKEELFIAYKEKKVHYDKMKDQVEFLQQYINQFSESIKNRARIFCELRNWITEQTSARFTKNLKLLNFNGSLKIYHKACEVDGKQIKEQTLDIKINPKSSDPTMLYKDTRSLSGGERSFSTVAFLIALWESSYSPFNIIDEVDVFMDRVTRNMALEALIDSANKKQGKQYIFLSPLRPEKKGIQNLLKIFYMPEPKRVTGDES